MTIQQAATAWHISDRTVRRAIKDGKLPARQVPHAGIPNGFRWALDDQDVQRWGLATGRSDGGAGPTTPAPAAEQEDGSAAAHVQALEDDKRRLLDEVRWLRQTIDRMLIALPPARQPLQTPPARRTAPVQRPDIAEAVKEVQERREKAAGAGETKPAEAAVKEKRRWWRLW